MLYRTHFTSIVNGTPSLQRGYVDLTASEILFKADDSEVWITIMVIDPRMTEVDRNVMAEAFAHTELTILRDEIRAKQKLINEGLKREGSKSRFVLDYDSDGFPIGSAVIELKKDWD